MVTFQYGTWKRFVKDSISYKMLLSTAKGYKTVLTGVAGAYDGFIIHNDDPTYLNATANQSEASSVHVGYASFDQKASPVPITPEVLSGSIDDTYTFKQPFSLDISGYLTIKNIGDNPQSTSPSGIFARLTVGSDYNELVSSDLVDTHGDGTLWEASIDAEISYDLVGDVLIEMDCSSGVACGGTLPLDDLWSGFEATFSFTLRGFGRYGLPSVIVKS